MTISTSSLQLTCLCGAINEPGTLLSSPTLPILSELCHCNSCRYTSGALGLIAPSLIASPSQRSLSRLTSYQFSSMLTRYFCSTCGCHCFVHRHEPTTRWMCLGGIIEPAPIDNNGDRFREETHHSKPINTVKISRHAHVRDTIDGGMAPILLSLNGRSIPTWSAAAAAASTDESAEPDNAKFDLPHATIRSLPSSSSSSSSSSKSSNSKSSNSKSSNSSDLAAAAASAALPQPQEGSFLSAKCHCGGVSLLLRRANFGPHETARYVPRRDRAKYKTYFCACRSCRLSTGVSLTPWATVTPENVLNANARGIEHDDDDKNEDDDKGHGPTALGPSVSSASSSSALLKQSSSSRLLNVVFGHRASGSAGSKVTAVAAASDSDPNPGLTLRYHWSTPGGPVCRSFCGVCGATVAYWNAERPDEVDLAVGILRAAEGSMARRWLEWEWGRCSFVEESIDGEVSGAWAGATEEVMM